MPHPLRALPREQRAPGQSAAPPPLELAPFPPVGPPWPPARSRCSEATVRCTTWGLAGRYMRVQAVARKGRPCMPLSRECIIVVQALAEWERSLGGAAPGKGHGCSLHHVPPRLADLAMGQQWEAGISPSLVPKHVATSWAVPVSPQPPGGRACNVGNIAAPSSPLPLLPSWICNTVTAVSTSTLHLLKHEAQLLHRLPQLSVFLHGMQILSRRRRQVRALQHAPGCNAGGQNKAAVGRTKESSRDATASRWRHSVEAALEVAAVGDSSSGSSVNKQQQRASPTRVVWV